MTKKKKQGHEFGCCPNTHAKFYEISLIIGFNSKYDSYFMVF